MSLIGYIIRDTIYNILSIIIIYYIAAYIIRYSTGIIIYSNYVVIYNTTCYSLAIPLFTVTIYYYYRRAYIILLYRLLLLSVYSTNIISAQYHTITPPAIAYPGCRRPSLIHSIYEGVCFFVFIRGRLLRWYITCIYP